MGASSLFTVVTQRVSRAGSTCDRIGSLRADQHMTALGLFLFHRTLRACNFCDLRWSLIENNFFSECRLLYFTTLTNASVGMVLYRIITELPVLMEFQSSVLSDLQVKYVDCTKIMTACKAISWVRLW